MAFTLGFHIILACFGVALPAIMLIANYRGLRRDDADALLLARRWSKVVAVTFAVGAVTGTVLSFEFGLLWPEFTGRFGQVFGVLFAIEGICFFLEAIFVAIYIFGWERLRPWTHFWAGVPIVITGIGGAFSVVAVNSWMNQPQGFSPTTGKVTSGRAAEGDLQPGRAVRGPAHDPRRLHGHRVRGGVGLRRRDAARAPRSLPPARPVDPAHARLHPRADPVRGRRHGGARDRQGPADQVRGHGVRADDRHARHRVPLRPLHAPGRQGRDRDPGLRLVPGRVEHRHEGDRARHRAARGPAAGQHDAALGVRHDGRDRDDADRPGGVAGVRVVAQARHPADEVVPARRRGVGRRDGGRDGVRLDRHRGRPPTVDRLRDHAHRGRRHQGGRRLGHVRAHRRPLRDPRRRPRDHAAARWRAAGAPPTSRTPRSPTGRPRSVPR